MPKFNNQLLKSIYVAVNAFFLITAPFNLGYYSYKLGQTFQPDVIEMPPLVAGSNTASTKATDNQKFLDESNVSLTLTASPEPDMSTNNPEDLNGTKPKGSVNVFFCISDSEAALWEINLGGRVIDSIRHKGAYDNSNEGLLIYCQSKTRIKDMGSVLMIKRIDETGEVETLIDTNDLLSISYLVLSFDKASGSVNYEVRSERPE